MKSGPVVRTLRLHCQHQGSIPGLGTKIPKPGCMAGKKKPSEDLLISKSGNYSKCLKSKMEILSMNTGVPKTLNFAVLEFRRKTIQRESNGVTGREHDLVCIPASSRWPLLVMLVKVQSRIQELF